MRVAALIEQYNTERPNNVEDNLKVNWLKKCEQMIINEVIDSHEHDPMDQKELQLQVYNNTLYIQAAGSLADHMAGFNVDTELLVPEPYDDVYMFWLDQRIALDQNDKNRYNAAAQRYNNALLVYQQYYNRNYVATRPDKKTFNHANL